MYYSYEIESKHVFIRSFIHSIAIIIMITPQFPITLLLVVVLSFGMFNAMQDVIDFSIILI